MCQDGATALQPGQQCKTSSQKKKFQKSKALNQGRALYNCIVHMLTQTALSLVMPYIHLCFCIAYLYKKAESFLEATFRIKYVEFNL